MIAFFLNVLDQGYFLWSFFRVLGPNFFIGYANLKVKKYKVVALCEVEYFTVALYLD